MFSIAIFSLLAAVAPAQEVVEDQECEFYEEYTEEADSGEVVFSDDVVSEEAEEIVFDEE